MDSSPVLRAVCPRPPANVATAHVTGMDSYVVNPYAPRTAATQAPPCAPPLPETIAAAPAERTSWRIAAGLIALVGLSAISWLPGPPPSSRAQALPTQVDTGTGRTSLARDIVGRHDLHHPIESRLPLPLQVSGRQIAVDVEVPPAIVRKHSTTLTMWAEDVHGRRQYTNWADGVVDEGNTAWSPARHTLTLTMQPSLPAVDPRGYSSPGFDPSTGIKAIGLEIHTQDAPLDATVNVQDVRLENAPARPQALPIERPLLRATPTAPHPLRVQDVHTGVSRYFVYGDLHRWPAVAPQAHAVMARQHSQGLDGFRLMGGLDVRSTSGHGSAPGPREIAATRAFLRTAEETGQTHVYLTMLDGAIANDVLRSAMRDADAGRRLVDGWRPFIREFGNQKIGGQPVVFDLVNEIHGVGGVTLRERQQFVETLMDAFVEEAPHATVTLGLHGYQELQHWTYLFDAYAGKPIHFAPTFHAWEDVARIPPVWALNLPEGTEVGITEADPTRDMERTLRLAADKGYSTLLFWSDAQHPYEPATHRKAMDAAVVRSSQE